MILIIDNYDSFTYNLVHLVASSASEFDDSKSIDSKSSLSAEKEKPALLVRRNDQISIDEITALAPDGILISPGPGRPEDAGVCVDVVARLSDCFPILGVCLGHQIIGEAFGGSIDYAPTLMHGKTSQIHHDGQSIFQSVPDGFTATRYHSLVVAPDTISDDLDVSARTSDGVIMGLRHKTLPVEGIQFHPESILTLEGPKIIANWVRKCLNGEPTHAPDQNEARR